MVYHGCISRKENILDMLINKKDKTGFVKWIKECLSISFN